MISHNYLMYVIHHIATLSQFYPNSSVLCNMALKIIELFVLITKIKQLIQKT